MIIWWLNGKGDPLLGVTRSLHFGAKLGNSSSGFVLNICFFIPHHHKMRPSVRNLVCATPPTVFNGICSYFVGCLAIMRSWSVQEGITLRQFLTELCPFHTKICVRNSSYSFQRNLFIFCGMLGYDEIMICAGGDNSQTISDRVVPLSHLENASTTLCNNFSSYSFQWNLLIF